MPVQTGWAQKGLVPLQFSSIAPFAWVVEFELPELLEEENMTLHMYVTNEQFLFQSETDQLGLQIVT